jgi:HK97 family phage prohead protease
MDLKNIERKTLDVKFTKSSFSEDDQYYYFSGYGATFGNVDRGGDVVKSGAFTKSLSEMMPKFCYQHDMQDPIGVFTEVKEDCHGLFIRGKMRKGFEKTRWIAGLIEDGAIDSMSIGYSIDKYEYAKEAKVCYLTELKLFEVSFVTIPMNPEAKLTSFKSFVFDEMKTIRDVEKSLMEAGMSGKEAKTLISKIKEFSSRDEDENPEQKRDAAACDNGLSPILAEIKNFTNQIYQQNISLLCQKN